jgi:hypothetical protein
MPAVMILNPKKSHKRRRRGPRKMTAKQLRYFGPRKKKAAKSSPRVVVVTANPRHKRRSTVSKKRRHRRTDNANPKRRTRRFHRNPKSSRRFNFLRNPRAGGFLDNTLVPAAIGAGGALAVDFLMANVSMLPANMKQGSMLPLVKIGAALLIGLGVGAVAGEEAGGEAAAGGIIVTLYNLTKGYMTQNMPNFRMARYVPMKGLGARRFRRMRGMRSMKGLGIRRRRMARYVAMRGLGAPRPFMAKRMRGLGASMPPGMRNRGGMKGMKGLGYVNIARQASAPTPAMKRFLSN